MSKDELEKFKDKVVVITIMNNSEIPYLSGTFLTLLRYDEHFKRCYLSHPCDINDDYNVDCGEASFDYSDVAGVIPASDEEFAIWKTKYEGFHNEVMQDKGYDTCEVNFETIIKQDK